jgi:histidinol dehydrogenase
MTSAAPTIPRWDARDPSFEASFGALERRRLTEKVRIESAVGEIVTSIERDGDRALLEAIQRHDGYRLEARELWVPPAGIEPAGKLDEEGRAALAVAAERIRAFHAEHVPRSWSMERDGDRLGQLVRPLERVGLYVPAGSAPLASTVLMLGVPASVAGVAEIGIASPGLRPHPAVLEAARLVGVGRVLRAGGAQAVAALAFGTESVPRVDKIVGPGNAWVQTAKRLVFGQVGIDSEAGASEVLIVADATPDPAWVAADLLAQAEHDPNSSAVLVTTSAELIEATARALEIQLADLPRAAIARRALAEKSALILARDLDQAFALANRYAAEHLQVLVAEPERWLPRVAHAGAVFVGDYTPVPVGDYVAGPSHVLPTGGTARFFSVLGVEDFQKRSSLVQLSREGLRRVGPHGVRLAEIEGLEGHARALRLRLYADREQGSN